MRALLATVALCALVFGVSFAGAKVANVTNPMSADLNANHFQIYDAAGYGVNGDETSIGANYVGTRELWVSVTPGSLDDVNEIMAGTAPPDVAVPTLKPGSLYLRRTDAAHGALYVKTGAAAADWTCIAGC